MSFPATSMNNAASPGARLRAMMDRTCVGLPGAFNGMVARLAAQAGFEGLYVSGAAVSASFGVPDIGLVTLNEFCNVVEQVSRASGLPVLADADTGFGEGEMLVRVLHEYARAGAAGFHIEDQVFPKRCGHLDGKSLVPVDHMLEKVSRAAGARDAIDGKDPARSSGPPGRGSFVVCARTDARGVEGIDAVITRAKAYIDAGADMIFPEGLASEEEFGKVAEALRSHSKSVYLLANMTEFGKTPVIPLSRFAKLGYHAVIWPVTTLRAAMGEVTRILGDLKRDGDVSAFLSRVQTREALYRALGYTPGVEWTWPGRGSGHV
ncbi:MAG TPA: isocitrate lyase/phosphoenolpyruvate mutase family protein [Phycisphaerales bacterium]|nr:isocitrate lyase/phosphoenolpyruvate mutase family protein [Phycisphaerales bacterium]